MDDSAMLATGKYGLYGARRGRTALLGAVVMMFAAIVGLPTTAYGKEARMSGGQTKFGRSVFELQVLLDRARFSAGVIDGRWGRNTETAFEFFLEREADTDSSSRHRLDDAAYARLQQLAGAPDGAVTTHRLTESDVSGPFKRLPAGIYEQAKGDCMCYESLGEKLAELFHTTPAVLAALNPGLSLDGVSAGDSIDVPNVEPMQTTSADADETSPSVVRIDVSDKRRYVQAFGADGRLLFHFPSTLGSELHPSPGGDYEVSAVAFDPTWHFQPELLGETGYDRDALIPPGPNSPVGLVWIDLSKPHYGIHGTSAPETIGYAVSHGCVRLTNWDALFLARRVGPGVTVRFVDVA